jgi:hypothetical protein
MRIPFLVQEGKFLPAIRSVIKDSGVRMPVTVELQVCGGYGGTIRVKIERLQLLEFEADWESRDWTRFPARIRAAATALRDTGHFGTFDISHNEGTLRISEA